MDQTPLQFEFMTGNTYTEWGTKDVWLYSQQNGFEKWQCTVQLTIHADGELHTPPLIIFHGKAGSKILKKEKLYYDKGVKVIFQKKAWSDKISTIYWQKELWCFLKADMSDSILDPTVDRLLIIDAHRAQKSASIIG